MANARTGEKRRVLPMPLERRPSQHGGEVQIPHQAIAEEQAQVHMRRDLNASNDN
jgi:hypothetical protein